MSSNWFILTLSCQHHPEQPTLHNGYDYVKGQQERGENGFLHWQFVVHSTKKVRCTSIKSTWPQAHIEATRSAAALEYVWKDDTRITGTQFELGQVPVQRNSKKDWDSIWENATKGNFSAIPPDIRTRCYNQLKRVATDHQKPTRRLQVVAELRIGPTGTGKSYTSWRLAGDDAYPKDPRNKWWDGYQGQEAVVIDEFTGMIGIEHILRWLDVYPVSVEVKGGSVPLKATRFYLTSNKPVETWWPDATPSQIAAIKRRLTVIEMNETYVEEEEHDLFNL